MSEFNRAFRASGLDASGKNVINVADPRAGEFNDGINQGYFINENTVQTYDPTRESYDVGFIVEYNQRLYKNIIATTAPEAFTSSKWRALRTDPQWETVDTSTGSNTGDYLILTASSSVTITLPESPIKGDTVTIRDGNGVLRNYPATINAGGAYTIATVNVSGSRVTTTSVLLNTPYSTIYFVFNGVNWTYQVDQDVFNTLVDASHSTQQGTSYLANGGYVATSGESIAIDASDKTIAITLPPRPNVGDIVTLRDIAYNHAKTRVQIGVHSSATTQVIENPRTGAASNKLTLDNIGAAILQYVGGANYKWVMFISNNTNPYIKIGSNSSADLIVNRKYDIDIQSGVSSLTLTLPESPVGGDWVAISNLKSADKAVTIRVHPDFGSDDSTATANEYKIASSFEDLRLNKYSHYNTLSDTFVSSFVIDDNDTGYSFVLYYDADKKVWDFADVETRIDIADENYRKRPGIVPLASPTEALAHGIEYAHSEDTAKSWADQNPLKDHVITVETLDARRASETQVGIARVASLTSTEALELSRTVVSGNEGTRYADSAFRHDIFITPRSLNARIATETRRGVVEIATQNEVRSTTNDEQVLTPKKFHAAQAEENLTGVGKLVVSSGNIASNGTVSSTANMRSDRALNGADNTVFDKTDHLRFVTPKTLDEYRATETQPGMLWVATSAELRVNDSTVDNAIITPKKLAAWKASSTIRGIARAATQAETNASSGSGESWSTVFVTPETLYNRIATESRRGLTEIATQAEADAGTDDYRYITPEKFSTWLGYEHFETNSTAGISHTGNIWDGVSFDIALATETQRGTLEVATQTEANAQSSQRDDVIITPKKLDARRATTTLAGIAELADDTQAIAGTDTATIMTPAQVLNWTRNSSNSRASETRYGTLQNATAAETFVGDSTSGSTQAYTSYDRHSYAVSPYGLHYALRNYLPLNAKADDSELLDGLNSTQFARSDQNDTISGIYTFTQNELIVSGTNPSVELIDTSYSAMPSAFLHYQTGMMMFSRDNDPTSDWVLRADMENGTVEIESSLTTGAGATIGGTIIENESSANGRSPGTGSLRTKYLGINNMAATAAKWETARTITLAGDTTGSVSLDGSANVSLTVAVKDNSHNHSGENITTGTVSNDRLNKSSRTNQGIVQVTSDVRTSDPTDASDPHMALSAGAGKVLSERIDLFTPDGGTGESVTYRDYIQIGTVRMSTNNEGVLEFTYGHAI